MSERNKTMCPLCNLRCLGDCDCDFMDYTKRIHEQQEAMLPLLERLTMCENIITHGAQTDVEVDLLIELNPSEFSPEPK